MKAAALSAILFIPGQFSEGSHAGAVAALGRQVVGVTLPGFGGSPAPAGVDFGAGFIQKQVSAAAPEGKLILIGNSAGAQWAAVYAARHPGKVERVILLNPGGFWVLPPPVIASLMKDFTPEKLASWDDAKMTRDFGGLFTNPAARDAFLADLLSKRFSPEAASGYIRASFQTSMYAPLGALAAARIPVDIVLGAADPFLQLDPIRQAAYASPFIDLHEIPGCGHIPQLDCPSETEAVLRGILR